MNKLLLVVLCVCVQHACFSQQQRALVIGIDTYTPTESYPASNRFDFGDLQGCRNDAESFKALLETGYQFQSSHIKTLYDREASRQNILNAFDSIKEVSNSGDIVVVYYAGHGSQVMNSLSAELDKRDETIVPADAWVKEGMDITDKQLARIFNSFIDKKVVLTVIFDCCHSGSLSRSINRSESRSRSLKPSKFDTKDASQMVPPEQRSGSGFLILSASQDNQLAVEQKDENNIPHGAFTLALLQAIQQQSFNAPVNNIFNSLRAILKVNGKRQEPVLGGNAERVRGNLIGKTDSPLPEEMLIPVSGFQNNKVELQAGYALQLSKGNELTAAGINNKIVLRIDSILSLSKSLASVIEGDIDSIRAGELFKVSNWIASTSPLLKVYIADAGLSNSQSEQTRSLALQLRNNNPKNWIKDIESQNPDMFIQRIRNGYRIYQGNKVLAFKESQTADIVKLASKKKIFFNIPATENVREAIRSRLNANRNISITESMKEADYILYGNFLEGNKLSYGWMSTDLDAKDSLGSIPMQTKAIETGEGGAAKLAEELLEQATRLSKIKGWLMLKGPSSKSFPFHLELFSKASGKKIESSTVKTGEQVSLHLVSNYEKIQGSIPQKYIYAFAIDRTGAMTLLYPEETGGNVENKFPVYQDQKLLKDIRLCEFEIAEPVGTDTYFLLATDEPLQNYPLLFNQEGVRNLSIPSTNPIAPLLNLGNYNQSRGITRSAASWILLKYSIKSTH